MRPSGSASVLVVDDDPGIRLFFSAALQDAGYRVMVAGGGLEALERIAAEPPDLVLTDYQMPGMSGVQLFVTLRARGFSGPVVLMSAGSNARAEAIAYGLNAYLPKPMNLEHLLAVVAEQMFREPTSANPPLREAPLRLTVVVVNASDDLLQLLGATVEEAGFNAILLRPSDVGREVASVRDVLNRYDPKVVVYDVSVPYPANWALFCSLRDAERLAGTGRQFIATTPNKQALEERTGTTTAIELVGDLVNRSVLARVIARAAVGPDVCC